MKAYVLKRENDVEGIATAFGALQAEMDRLSRPAAAKEELLNQLQAFADSKLDSVPDEEFDAWDEALTFIGLERQRDEVFKQPEALAYVAALQEELLRTGVAGKSNSLADIVKTVHRELRGRDDEFRIPDSASAVAQCLTQFESGHRPQDLGHFVTRPDYRTSNIWVQLRSGDNRDMAKVVEAIDNYVAANPPPFNVEHRWFGLTYINVIWQDKMVSGMLQAFLGSFLVVLLMMTVLFRSALWGLLCMLPLTVTIGLIYGIIGLVGKDYDMPVAVLSSLSLGLAVDYAIHFLARSRALHAAHGSWAAAAGPVFGEPARAIARNVVVIGAGFLPLLAATLMPYKTVGMFIAAILVAAGVASLLILPSVIAVLEKWLFPATRARSVACRCGTCIVASIAAVAVIAVNVRQFFKAGWTTLTVFSVIAIPILIGICAFSSHREKCRAEPSTSGEGENQ